VKVGGTPEDLKL